MEPRRDPAQIFTDRVGSYDRFVRWVRYRQGIRAYFLDSPLLRSGLRVMDAGCGTGIVTFALRDALLRRSLVPGPIQAFDLTPAMIERFRGSLRTQGIEGIEVVQGDVLQLDQLPAGWRDYDLIVSASMMEYLPRERLSAALGGLRSLLKNDGHLVLLITRRNWLTRPLIGRWWQSNLYTASELEAVFQDAGFSAVTFGRFPFPFRYLASWGFIIEARP